MYAEVAYNIHLDTETIITVVYVSGAVRLNH